jgi:hypothetical protein
VSVTVADALLVAFHVGPRTTTVKIPGAAWGVKNRVQAAVDALDGDARRHVAFRSAAECARSSWTLVAPAKPSPWIVIVSPDTHPPVEGHASKVQPLTPSTRGGTTPLDGAGASLGAAGSGG